MTEPELIEAMARAIEMAESEIGRPDWKRRFKARAALEAIKAKGCKVIERPPTRMKDFHSGAGVAHTIRTGPAKDWDAAPWWPGGEK